MMNEFLTLDYILSFPGMMVICWLAVTVLKNLVDRAFPNNKTMWVVAITALALVGLKTLLEFNQEISARNILVALILWVINASVVWFATMKAHELIVEK